MGLYAQGMAEKTFEGFGAHEGEDKGEKTTNPVGDLLLAVDRDLDGLMNFFVMPFQTMAMHWRATPTEMKQLTREQWFINLYVQGMAEKTFLSASSQLPPSTSASSA